MNTRLTPQDQITLSTYLDGQLSARAKEKLEARLAASLELREELDALRRTRALLRLTPQRRAPRNYTLRPEQVPAQRSVLNSLFQWVPALRVSSALASLLAVLLAALNLLPMAGAVAPLSAPESLKSSESFAAPEMEAQQTTPVIIIWGAQQVPGLGGKGGGPADLPTDPRDLGPQVTLVPEVSAENATQDDNAEPTADLPLIEGSGPILGVRPFEEAGQIQPDPVAREADSEPMVEDAAAQGHPQRIPEPRSTRTPWLIPGALLIVALFTGGLSFYLQRKKI